MPDINDKNRPVSLPPSAPQVRLAVQLAKCALFVVLMIVSAFIRIPIPYVPLTFQTAVAVLAGLLLGAKWGTVSVAVYIFMGLLGLPVFSGGGGFAYVFQLTFGYIIGFAAAAFASGAVRGRKMPALRRAAAAALAGVLANYLIGVPYFAIIWKFYMNMDGLWYALLVNNILFMPKDLILCLLAAVLAERISKAVSGR